MFLRKRESSIGIGSCVCLHKLKDVTKLLFLTVRASYLQLPSGGIERIQIVINPPQKIQLVKLFLASFTVMRSLFAIVHSSLLQDRAYQKMLVRLIS
jgi:hypothetical protein